MPKTCDNLFGISDIVSGENMNLNLEKVICLEDGNFSVSMDGFLLGDNAMMANLVGQGRRLNEIFWLGMSRG